MKVNDSFQTWEDLFIKSYTRTRDYRERRTRNFFNPAHLVQCSIFHQIWGRVTGTFPPPVPILGSGKSPIIGSRGRDQSVRAKRWGARLIDMARV